MTTLTIDLTTYDLLEARKLDQPDLSLPQEMLILRRPQGRRIGVAFRSLNGAVSPVTNLPVGMKAGNRVSA